MPAKAGIQYALTLVWNRSVTAYWIVRRSLSSGGRSADPLADDDAVGVVALLVISRGVLGVRGLIHQAVEFASVSDLQLEKPGLAGGVGIDQRRLG
jgi:hypothetical protein